MTKSMDNLLWTRGTQFICRKCGNHIATALKDIYEDTLMHKGVFSSTDRKLWNCCKDSIQNDSFISLHNGGNND